MVSWTPEVSGLLEELPGLEEELGQINKHSGSRRRGCSVQEGFAALKPALEAGDHEAAQRQRPRSSGISDVQDGSYQRSQEKTPRERPRSCEPGWSGSERKRWLLWNPGRQPGTGAGNDPSGTEPGAPADGNGGYYGTQGGSQGGGQYGSQGGGQYGGGQGQNQGGGQYGNQEAVHTAKAAVSLAAAGWRSVRQPGGGQPGQNQGGSRYGNQAAVSTAARGRTRVAVGSATRAAVRAKVKARTATVCPRTVRRAKEDRPPMETVAPSGATRARVQRQPAPRAELKLAEPEQPEPRSGPGQHVHKQPRPRLWHNYEKPEGPYNTHSDGVGEEEPLWLLADASAG